jgi:hypothetical protein
MRLRDREDGILVIIAAHPVSHPIHDAYVPYMIIRIAAKHFIYCCQPDATEGSEISRTVRRVMIAR